MDKRYKAGIELFDQEKFHEAHDIWEEMWTEKVDDPNRTFYQALIQAAVSFYLIQEERYNGAYKVYKRSIKNLESLESEVLGINVTELIALLHDFYLPVSDLVQRDNKTKIIFKAEFFKLEKLINC